MKFLSLAALALTFAACSSNDDELTQLPAEQPANNNMITVTAKLAPKSGSAQTRAVSDDGTNIVVDWAANEHIAILYTVGSDKKVADAEITSVNEGVATITFAVDGSTVDGTACQIVYPLSAAMADNSGVKAYADMLAAQDGVLDGDLDVRVGAGTIQTSTPSLTVTTQPEAQFAIFKFTLSGQSIDATHPLVIKKGENEVVTTVTPASSTTSVYVAMPPAASSSYRFIVTTDNNKYIKSGTAAITAGKYYQTTLNLSTARYPLALTSATVDDLGSVIASDGKIYLKNAATPSGNTGVAMIAYVGNDAETSPTNTAFKNGLALALEDAAAMTWCSQNEATCLGTQYDGNTIPNDLAGIANTDALVNHTGHTHAAASAARGYNSGTHPAGTSAWFLPSGGQWDKMAKAAGYANLITNAGLQESGYYWLSTEGDGFGAWQFNANNYHWCYSTKNYYNDLVRACLAF